MKHLHRTLAPFLAVIILMGSPDILAAQERVEANVVYGMYSGTALLMDVHYPADPNGYGIVFIFGSGWHAPQHYDAQQLKGLTLLPGSGATALLNAGYTLFSINHRAAPRFRFPAAVEDARRAVKFVRHNAERFAIDPDQIGATGLSSGGHLASMLGVADDPRDTGGSSPVERESSKVQAVVAYCPATDLAEFVVDGEGQPAVVSSFVGLPFAEQLDTDPYRRASPTSYVSADDAPVLLVHGDADSQVPFKQSETLRDRLEEAGVETRLIRLPGAEHPGRAHGFESPNGDTPDYLAATVEWFDEHLGVER